MATEPGTMNWRSYVGRFSVEFDLVNLAASLSSWIEPVTDSRRILMPTSRDSAWMNDYFGVNL